MEGTSIVAFVVIFLTAGITLLVGTQILGSTSSGFSCTNLQGYDITKGSSSTLADNVDAEFPAGTWAGSCWQTQKQIQQSYSLMVVILVIVAAAAILLVVRSFSS